MPEIEKDLKGREVVKYSLPGLGTKLVVNGNEFRINYVKHKPCFRFTAEFLRKYEPRD